VRYRNRTFAIDYTAAAEAELLAALDELRGDDRRKELPRSHDEPARCAHCGYRDTCDERL
jgi:CRISPR-associated exonuclease Cas4